MKKILAYTLAFLSIVLVSCQKENVIVQEGQTDSEKSNKVSVKLNFTIPDATPMTKALGEDVDLAANGLWVAVYESGYRCEVVQATDLILVDASTNKYECSLKLSVTENPRNLHFISMNGFYAEDVPYEETRLGSLISDNNLDAYWQIRTVSCIPYNAVADKWAAFVSELGSITLIRNFAKATMSVKDGVKFQLASFKVFNTPDKGYVAPYISSGESNGFIYGYDLLDYKYNTTTGTSGAIDVYPGRMPIGCTLNGYTSADAGDGTTLPTSFITWNSVDDAQYFYERPVPTESPAFIIVAGKFDHDDDGSYTDESYSYYKINLRDGDDNYYALLRGFRFKVNIETVTATGYSTVIEAYNSAGSGDISTSLEYSSVNNISDNVCRLFVNATSFTAIKAGTIEVKYKFIPNVKTAATTVKNTEVDVDVATNTGVEITLKDPATGIQPSVASYHVYSGTGTEADVDGWRTISITTNAPENLYKEQVINIRGRGNDGANTTVIQRDVHIIVRPTLALYVEMAQPTGLTYSSVVPSGKDKDVWINIWVEDELPESIFPLNIKIEATKLTLSPASGEQLPVESGQSASTADPKPAFYFVKTLTWAEYNILTQDDDKEITIGGSTITRKMRKFVCKFKTNTAASASDIYVSHELFNTATTSFTNP